MFTATGQCAPIFAFVFGLKLSKMPHNEIIICKCKGLVAASNVNGSTEVGFIVFICRRYEPNETSTQSAPSSTELSTDIHQSSGDTETSSEPTNNDATNS